MVDTMNGQSQSIPGLPPAVGVVGLGAMGKPMAANLIAAAGPATRVLVHHRAADRVTGVTDAGAEFAATPQALSAGARVILLMLPDLPQVEEVLAGPTGLIAGISQPTV